MATDEVASDGIPTDWSAVARICEDSSILLDKNDPTLVQAGWQADRDRFREKHHVEHADTCWLGKNYANQPTAWAHGCDCGAIQRASEKNKR